MNPNIEDLNERYGYPITLTNGFVIDIHKDTCKLQADTSAIWILRLLGKLVPPSVSILRSKVRRIYTKSLKWRGTRLEEFRQETFELPQAYLEAAADAPLQSTPSTSPAQDDFTFHLSAPIPTPSTSTILTPRPKVGRRKERTTPQKKANALTGDIIRYERQVAALQLKIQNLKKDLREQAQNSTHYNIKNVKKREERNIVMRQILRKDRTTYKAMAKKLELDNGLLREELKAAKINNSKLEKKVGSQSKKLRRLVSAKKTSMKKAQQYKKRIVRRKRESKKKSDDQVARWKRMFEEGDSKEMDTKTKDGEFTDETRFVVMELAGLEVATSKIGTVMETVSKYCKRKLSCLPSKSACQRIIDEGQVIAQTYIRQKVLKRSKSFGLHKDGTTRKKVKILDTSIQTDEGESFCLGWSSVLSETGQAISDEARDKLQEIAGAGDQEEPMIEILKKLDYMMNDRAANEKKSSRLLEEWRRDCLTRYGEDNINKVHHLFCAAHVLLGFHTNVMALIKKIDFLISRDFKHPILIMLRDASDIFGPVGDYRGVRNKWESLCSSKNIKSCIKSYKDNRFNALFEVAAQVHHHREDFLVILKSLASPNAKQARLLKSLQDPNLILLSECLGIVFHKITGPFWTMVISSISLKEFQAIIQKMKDSLQECSTSPHLLFDPSNFQYLSKFIPTSHETKESCRNTLKDIKMSQIVESISKGLLKTLETQLQDFLEGGTYSLTEVPKAPLTNLICERHFGHLDSSQKRRPHASLHHHSSIIILKQTRTKLREWYDTLTEESKLTLWRKARTEGRKLRTKHQQRDKDAIIKSFKLIECQEDTSSQAPSDLKVDQMIAVACHDTWYPAQVKEDSIGANDVTVSFAELGKGLGSFRWPTGKDVHSISRKSVVETDLNFQIHVSGRFYTVLNAEAVQQKFKKFQ